VDLPALHTFRSFSRGQQGIPPTPIEILSEGRWVRRGFGFSFSIIEDDADGSATFFGGIVIGFIILCDLACSRTDN
jgi:hypothetical protein